MQAKLRIEKKNHFALKLARFRLIKFLKNLCIKWAQKSSLEYEYLLYTKIDLSLANINL